MSSTKYMGMDVHTESISIAVRNSVGKLVMECVIETKASTIVQFINGLRGDLRVTFEEGAWATWLYDLLKPHVTEVLVCNTRKNASGNGSKSDRIDARKLSCCLAAASLLWLVAARGWRSRSLSERTFREGWVPVRRFVRSPVVFIEQRRR
jgi:hypothetical protein